jgi:hypothetical protein
MKAKVLLAQTREQLELTVKAVYIHAARVTPGFDPDADAEVEHLCRYV